MASKIPFNLINAAFALAAVPISSISAAKHLIPMLPNIIISNLPVNFKSISISQAAEILDINAETIRRKIRSGDLKALNENEIGGRKGYQLDANALVSLSKEFSKENALADYLFSQYRDTYEKILNKDYINNKLKNNKKEDHKSTFANTSDITDNNIVANSATTTYIDLDKNNLKKQLLELEIKSNELDIETLNSKIESITDLNEKIELLKKLLELKNKKLELEKELVACIQSK